MDCLFKEAAAKSNLSIHAFLGVYYYYYYYYYEYIHGCFTHHLVVSESVV